MAFTIATLIIHLVIEYMTYWILFSNDPSLLITLSRMTSAGFCLAVTVAYYSLDYLLFDSSPTWEMGHQLHVSSPSNVVPLIQIRCLTT